MTDLEDQADDDATAAAAVRGAHRWSTRQLANARRIEAVRVQLGLPVQARTIALAVAIVESSCLRLASRRVPSSLLVSWRDGIVAGDHDSIGVFQQRAAWGGVRERLAASSSARLFFLGGHGGQRGLTDIPHWATRPLGEVAQAVQVSAFPSRYQAHAVEAADLGQRAARR